MSGENPQTAAEETNDQAEEIKIEQDEVTLEADVQDAPEEIGGADQIAKLESELEEMKSKWLRAVAEEQNVRRRGEREKQDALKYGVTNFAREMVSVADNLGRALASATEEMKDSDLMTGVEMTERELQNAFKKAGIKRIEAEGQPFDHNLHQAMFEVPDENQPAGLVAQVMQDGYVIHDRLLRPAMVGVTKGGPKYEAPAEGDAAQGDDAPADAYDKSDAESGAKLDQET